MKPWLRAALILAAGIFAACEDQGNEGNDNLLTGISGLVIVVIAGLILWRVLSRRKSGGG